MKGKSRIVPEAALAQVAVRRWKEYSNRKASQSDWIDSYPDHWSPRALKRCVATKITDGPHETPELVDEGIDFISAEAVQDGRIDFSRRRGFISPELHRLYCRKCRPRRGDLFMCKSGATTGKLAMVETDMEFSVWSPLAQIRCDDSLAIPKFMYFALHAEYVQSQIRRTWSAGTQPNISMGDIEQLLVVAPPLPEQQAIAAFLDRETAKFDALVEKKRRLIELLKEKRAALISHAVTKGLDPDVPMKDSGIEWLGEVPRHWRIASLRHLSGLQTGLTLGKKYEEGRELVARPYLRVANVQDGYLDLGEITEVEIPPEDVSRYELKVGDVLLTEGGDFDKLGRGYVWDGQIDGCLHQNHIFAVRPDARVLDSHFLAALMSSSHGKHYFTSTSSQTTNLASTNSTKLRSFPVVLPPREEQRTILQRVKQDATFIDELSAKCASGIDRLLEYRTALISAAVTGKIDVRDT